MATNYRILLLGGGTGGHVFPLIAVAKSLRETARVENMEVDLLVMGDGEFIEKAAEVNQLPFKRILAGKLRRYFSLDISGFLVNTVDNRLLVFGFWKTFPQAHHCACILDLFEEILRCCEFGLF